MSDKKFEREPEKEKSARKKSWQEKAIEVENTFKRAMRSPSFVEKFYTNLFFLKPSLQEYFKDTKWSHQEIAIKKGIEHLLGFLGDDPENIHHKNIIRLSQSHSKFNLNIHPHNYYYWIDAMIMTLKEYDELWYDDLEYYTRECLFAPISFMISLYHKELT